MSRDGLSAEQYLSYINEYRPEVGDVDSPGFFYNLLSQYVPDRRWPDSPTEEPGRKHIMYAGWMYHAGIVIAREEDRVGDLLSAIRLMEPLDMQTYALLDIADEKAMPELLKEALDRWDEFVAEGEYEEDFDPSFTYEHICMLAAKFKEKELFEDVLGRIPTEHHPGVLTDAAQYGNESYVERAIKQLASLEHHNEADDYDVSINILSHALKTGNYSTAVLAISMSKDILFETEFFDDVVGKAAAANDLEKLREAVVEHAFGIHRYEFAIRLAGAGDEDSSLIAAESLRGIARTRDEDGDVVLHYYTRQVTESSERFGPEIQEKVKNKVKEFLNEAFADAYSAEDFITAYNAALGHFKITGSFEYFDELLSERTEKVVLEVADALVEEGYWGAYGPAALIISVLKQGKSKNNLLAQSLLKTYMRSGKQPFTYEDITTDADEILASGLISEDQYALLQAFLARDI